MPQRRRPELTEAVMGERFIGHRRSTRTFAAGRVCTHVGCVTRLSIYNAGALCSVHAALRPVTMAAGDAHVERAAS